MIFTGFEPNITPENVRAACHFLLPWNWKRWDDSGIRTHVTAWLQSYFDTDHAFLVDSGRSALFIALQALGVGKGDRVLVQAYTCIVVINAIRWCGGVPVYADIDDELNMDPHDLERKASGAKVVIIQHTFGTPADVSALVSIARIHRLQIIEDCAHSFGARYNEKLTGTFGDIGMFSFGSDKVVSCVRGGALITNNVHISERIREAVTCLPEAPKRTIFRQLLHYPIFLFGKKTYGLGIGKCILAFAKFFSVTTRIISENEKRGEQQPPYPTALPAPLAHLLLEQLHKVEDTNKHRKMIARYYADHLKNSAMNTNSIYLRFPLLIDTQNRSGILSYAKKKGVLLGDWYSTVVAPSDIKKGVSRYQEGSCPKAEEAARRSINLPTHTRITLNDAEYIVSILRNIGV